MNVTYLRNNLREAIKKHLHDVGPIAIREDEQNYFPIITSLFEHKKVDDIFFFNTSFMEWFDFLCNKEDKEESKSKYGATKAMLVNFFKREGELLALSIKLKKSYVAYCKDKNYAVLI